MTTCTSYEICNKTAHTIQPQFVIWTRNRATCHPASRNDAAVFGDMSSTFMYQHTSVRCAFTIHSWLWNIVNETTFVMSTDKENRKKTHTNIHTPEHTHVHTQTHTSTHTHTHTSTRDRAFTRMHARAHE